MNNSGMLEIPRILKRKAYCIQYNNDKEHKSGFKKSAAEGLLPHQMEGDLELLGLLSTLSSIITNTIEPLVALD